jgi:methylenetetrahydrofolate--tRNA-(uracil-5-)-methyltransferase
MNAAVTVIGAGLAGCEAAWQLAVKNITVNLVDMKPGNMPPAFTSTKYAELVCSNSLRSDELANAVGLLKEEMRRLGSLIMQSADETRIPAGGALAVDRERFSALVTERVMKHPYINIVEREVTDIPDGRVIIATGPLTSKRLESKIEELFTGSGMLNFFDCAAPIVTFDSIDMDNAFFASRYDRGDADYINCPMDKEQYIAFRDALISAGKAPVHGFEEKLVFEGCMPIEVMAVRGVDTIRYGPLKPVGLRDPKTGKAPYAIAQLRKDNTEGTLYNLVGFQTHLRFPEQKRVFGMIPALRDAEIVRFGVMHRNTFLDSPKLLDRYNRLKQDTRISFAGQITGVEGYVESASSGLLTGLEAAREIQGLPPIDFPDETAIGALALYISTSAVSDFQPMNINFGIIKPLEYRIKEKKSRNLEISKRSLEIIDRILNFGKAD